MTANDHWNAPLLVGWRAILAKAHRNKQVAVARANRKNARARREMAVRNELALSQREKKR